MNDEQISPHYTPLKPEFLGQKPHVAPIFYLILMAVTILLIGGYFILKTRQFGSSIACTTDAKLCPDGSAVGRRGPKCEFAPCPTITISTIPIITLSPPISEYECPQKEFVNCMPIVQTVDRPFCEKEYLAWASQNCPGFKGAAY